MKDSKTLVVYYSSSGNTRKAAEAIAAAVEGDTEEIRPVKPVHADIASKGLRNLTNFMKVGFGAITRRASAIRQTSRDPAEYALVIVGTPVYAGSVSGPVRAYLLQSGARLPEVAFFCTGGDSQNEKVLEQMQEISGRSPRATMAFAADQVKAGEIGPQVAQFALSIG